MQNKTVVMTEKVRKINAFGNSLPQHEGLRAAFGAAVKNKRVFTYTQVTPDHQFHLDREGSKTEIFQPETGKSASFDMPNAESLHAGNMQAWEVANKPMQLPVGTWVVYTGDWYVKHAVTVYKVVDAPIAAPEKPMETFTLGNAKWTEVPVIGGFSATVVVTSYRFHLMFTRGKVMFSGLPHAFSMEVEEVLRYRNALDTVLDRISDMQREFDNATIVIEATKDHQQEERRITTISRALAYMRALEWHADQNYVGHDNS